LAIDLVSSTILGFQMLSGLLAALLFFPQKRFFHTTAFSLFLLTFLVSVFLTLASSFFLFLFESGFALTWHFLFFDLFLLPFLDAFFALAAFALPLAFSLSLKKKLKNCKEARLAQAEAAKEQQALPSQEKPFNSPSQNWEEN
ncbi:MAG: hypothetical protein WC371_03555, partial [Parachlamydiales bacterium]